MDEEEVSRVRRFNRAVTQRIGVLGDDYLGSGRPLGEARLLFEVGQSAQGATVKALRARLALDSGYLSRMLRALEGEGLVRMARDSEDARVRRVLLSAKGKKEWQLLEQRSKDLVASLLQPLARAQRERLIAAMGEVERLLRASAVTVELADAASDEAQACIEAYVAELQHLLDGGFDPAQTVSATPEELVPPAGWFFIARLDGEAIGCGALKRLAGAEDTPGRPRAPAEFGEIKRMWVAPAARGLGVAQRLLEALEAQAVEAGLSVLRLDTHRHLSAARQLYERNGYVEIAAYNTNPYAQHWYEKRGLKTHA